MLSSNKTSVVGGLLAIIGTVGIVLVAIAIKLAVIAGIVYVIIRVLRATGVL